MNRTGRGIYYLHLSMMMLLLSTKLSVGRDSIDMRIGTFMRTEYEKLWDN
jgi:hypothetical protein